MVRVVGVVYDLARSSQKLTVKASALAGGDEKRNRRRQTVR